MYKEMRRRKLQTTKEEALRVLAESSYGVLATVNAEGEPRAVAVNAVLIDDETLVFHGAPVGEKMENIAVNPAVSYFVVAHEEVVAENFTTDYLSVSLQGKAELVTDEEEKFDLLVKLSQHFAPEKTEEEIRTYTYPARMGKVALVRVKILDIKGKYHPAMKS
ncbi:pyridoxamine 5'-phosphate oxidase family protein [Lactococcus nasutitermitis]|uniref:Pyridoxamine 5'-phosphate oxidase family protein n=1 Tax=Lactococcus nasutitermitis TaxID=1652957 RepID=A0ABV9JBC6_9LACT|nr:pyridoxamine 5'-phosphate oxidase family protein [Lactococcus nasutitermitis]